MQKIRLGVVGCGVIGRKHLEAAATSPLIELAGVTDLTEALAREAAEAFRIPAVYPDYPTLLKEDAIDAVVLAIPTAGRCDLAAQALRAGKHVLLEKPPGMNAREVERLAKLQRGRIVACASSRFRCYESARQATRFLAGAPLGDVRLVRSRSVKAAGPPPSVTPPPWRLSRQRNGGGILVNWGVYDLDYLLGLLGWRLKPRLVLAQAWGVPPQFESHVAAGSDAESHVAALIRCAGGEMISLERGEYMPTATDDAWQIIGTRGALRLMMVPGGESQVLHDDTSTEAGLVSRVIWRGAESYAAVHAGPVLDFAEAIVKGRPPSTSLENALLLQKTMDAIYASAKSAKAVTIR